MDYHYYVFLRIFFRILTSVQNVGKTTSSGMPSDAVSGEVFNT